MKFLIDAQLPRSLARYLQSLGHDAIHTLEMPHGNASTDRELIELAQAESRIVVSKDADFADTYYLSGIPEKLLHVTTGNIPNGVLLHLVARNIEMIEDLFKNHTYIELSHDAIVVHT